MRIDEVQALYSALAPTAAAAAAVPASPLPAGPAADGHTPNSRISTAYAGPVATQTLGKTDYAAEVRKRFSSLAERFDAAKAKGVTMSWQFNIDGAGKWYISIKNGKLTVKEGTGPKPNATWNGPADVYIKIAEGEMNKMFAFVRGKFKISGSRDDLEKFPTFFKGNSVD